MPRTPLNQQAGERPGFRPEVQALRALAVLLILVFHLWPTRIPGGFVGVDVFFVVSGFLITSHLVKELVQTGRIRLGRFYARRIRRLLPAAFLVLGVTLVGVFTLAPSVLWSTWLRDIFASAVYVVNWVLGAASIDYFAAHDAASPVQHFWSLAVEEQFYLVWPVLLLLAWLSRRKWVVLVAVSIVFTVCLAYSVWGAYEFPSFAYFATPAHGWEFAAGALLALLLPRTGLAPRWWLGLASWIGWAAIVASAFLFSASTPFPGWVALLPVVGTMTVIVAGMPEGRWSPAAPIAFAPTQFLGGISYSVYLWHWPLIVFAPLLLEVDRLTRIQKLSILAITILLAWATKVLVEDRVRVMKRLQVDWRTFAAAAAATVVVVGASLGPALALERAEQAATEQVLETFTTAQHGQGDPSCFGAVSSLNPDLCPESHVWTDHAPTQSAPEWVRDLQEAEPYFRPTVRMLPGTVVEVRSYAPLDTVPDFRVALVGDSHAQHLLPAILFLGKENGWAVDLYEKKSCRPLVQVFTSNIPAEYEDGCQKWKKQIREGVAAGEYDLVVTSSFTMGYHGRPTPAPDEQLVAEGFRLMWDTWLDAGEPILVVSDGPLYEDPVPLCVEEDGTQVDPCAVDRRDVTFPDPLKAAAASGDPRIATVDLISVMCDEVLCHPVVGGMITHRDVSHLNAGFALTLAPLFASAIERVAPGAFG